MRNRTLRRVPHLFRALLPVLALLALAGCSEPKDPGERVWLKKCTACHGKDGRGRTRFARNRPFADLTDGKWKQGGDPASIRRSVAEGVPNTPMEGFAGKLSPAELDAVTGRVLQLEAAARAGTR